VYGFVDNWKSIWVFLRFDNHLHRLWSWFCHRIVVSTSLDWFDTGDQPIFHNTLSMYSHWVLLVKNPIVQLLTYITSLRFWNGRNQNWSYWIICLENFFIIVDTNALTMVLSTSIPRYSFILAYGCSATFLINCKRTRIQDSHKETSSEHIHTPDNNKIIP
jgi:hypothetical protein